MIERDDVRAAVSSGLLSEKQAADLIALSDSRRGARENLDPGDEPFELFKGFNEIFIVIGLIILAFGWSGVVTLALGDEIIDLKRYAIMVTGAGAVLLWLLSEYFIRKRRMVAPAIALSVMFAGNAAFGFIAAMTQPFMIAQNDFTSVPLPLALATLALLAYWWRFRVPFAMAMIAVGLFVIAIVFTASRGGAVEEISDLFLLSAGGPFAWITLALGIVVFAVAMTFDMSDPHRVTRRAANGFWLHVVAAPALVNTLALSLLDRDTGGANAILFGVLMLFAVVAIVIDRRSFLIAAIGYIVALAATVFDGDGAALTVLILGVVLLLLGAFWERIRARILRVMPGFVPLHRLPPSQA
ncbi:hypothetical protein SLH49_21325 [Cognatiyoonia sp. IB215446]|uniref:hypothetical protein n=1 Tax=Cognatiyoonia sp. IB215446 TaxID=3097355 RepID=UPI002A0CCECD|nr:hypothetical protein [Cognatiyoonia sp. IB215446]MDX8350539.1 hypothetical protein [Cognatiyoonia sp. IB215446]